MKLKLFFFMCLAVVSVRMTAQCSKTYTTTGVYPDSLPYAWENVPYSQEVDFCFPTDTTLGGNTYHLDSVVITNVTGWPGSSFTYTCSKPNCQYSYTTGMTKFQGCINVSGNAPKGSAGNYKLTIDITGYVTLPFVGQQSYSISDTSVHFTVNVCTAKATVTPGSSTSFCKGDSVKLSAPVGLIYHWYKNQNILDSLQNIIVKDSGDYKLIVKDTNGCADTSAVNKVTVYPLPAIPVITQVGNKMKCTSPASSYQWFFKGNLISGATKDTFSPTSNGVVKVKVKNAQGCENTSNDYSFAYTGIDDPTRNTGLNVYPNPSNGTVNIQMILSQKEQLVMKIYNQTGQVVYEEKINYQSAYINRSIDLGRFGSGIYYIIAGGNNSQTVQRIVIQ